ncbi:hypothetical protein M3J09_009796 [Ascochyta lentis]
MQARASTSTVSSNEVLALYASVAICEDEARLLKDPAGCFQSTNNSHFPRQCHQTSKHRPHPFSSKPSITSLAASPVVNLPTRAELPSSFPYPFP